MRGEMRKEKEREKEGRKGNTIATMTSMATIAAITTITAIATVSTPPGFIIRIFGISIWRIFSISTMPTGFPPRRRKN